MNVLGPLLAGLLSFSLFATPALQSSNADDVKNQKLLLNLIAGTSSNGTLSAGFDSAIVGMKPLDTQTRFVEYTNSGTVEFATPTLGITAYTSAGSGGAVVTSTSINAILTTGSTAAKNGLRVWVQNCATNWSFTVGSSTASATCASAAQDVISTGSGVATVLNRAVPIANLVSSAIAMSNLNTKAGAINHLRYTIYIPAKSETTVNGKTNALYANPALDPTSLQGKNTWLKWTVTVTQKLVKSTETEDT